MLQASLDDVPINVGKESFDVLWPLRWFVIEDVCVLPNIHHQNWIKAGDVPRLVQSDPVIGQRSVHRILVTDGPTDSAHLADADELGLPNVIAAETLLRRLANCR